MSYAIYLKLKKDKKIKVGKLGVLFFKKGKYAYVGSSKRGNRVKRHERLNEEKKGKLHWHIDYLLIDEDVDLIGHEWFDEEECELARKFSKKWKVIKNFGSSDCNCEGHLFFIDE